MDANVIISAINSVGFPICTAIALMWYTKYQSDNNSKAIKEMREEYSKELKEIRQEHSEESKELKEVLANNTKALIELTDKLDAVESAIFKKRLLSDEDDMEDFKF